MQRENYVAHYWRDMIKISLSSGEPVSHVRSRFPRLIGCCRTPSTTGSRDSHRAGSRIIGTTGDGGPYNGHWDHHKREVSRCSYAGARVSVSSGPTYPQMVILRCSDYLRLAFLLHHKLAPELVILNLLCCLHCTRSRPSKRVIFWPIWRITMTCLHTSYY